MRMHSTGRSQVALHGSATAVIRYMRLAPAFSASAIRDEEKGRGTRSAPRRRSESIEGEK